MPTTRPGYAPGGECRKPPVPEVSVTDNQRILHLADAGFPGVELAQKIKTPLHTPDTMVDL